MSMAQFLLGAFILAFIVYHIVWLYFKIFYNRDITKESNIRIAKKEAISKHNREKATATMAELFNTVDNFMSKAIDIQRAIDRRKYYLTDMTEVPLELYDEYQVYLRSKKWKALRKVVIKRDNYRCTGCGYIGHLQVHHIDYRGVFEMEFIPEQLVTYCGICHTDEHIRLKALKEQS